MMQAEWRRVEDLVESALKLEPGRRAAFLDDACRGDDALRREVESLLAYEGRLERFMSAPVLDMLAAGSQGEPEPPRFPEGLEAGPYRIGPRIGRGGMGEVYRARDTRLDRDVALKFLPAGSPDTPDALERFRREARAVSSLNHPNICTLYDLGELDGQPFLVMELVEGESLRERLAKGVVAPAEALSIASQVCEGLEAAHAKGVVHRDIKPANIFLTPRGAVKILDFGLAKLLAAPHTAAEAAATATAEAPESTITILGRAMGTASYMSPEQARGEDVDSRSDLFSLGVVLYHLVTGARPFEGETTARTVEAILTRQPVPPRQRNPAVPEGLERVVLKALEKDRAARYQSAAELRADVERLRRPVSMRSRWLAAVAAALCLALIGTLAGLKFGWFGAPSRTPQLTRRDVTANPAEDPVIRGSISPDGQYVAYMDLAGAHVRRIETGETRHVEPEPGCCFR